MASTEKTVRVGTQWTKVTRDAKTRTFTFARGCLGSTRADEVQSYPFSAIATWNDATAHAKRHMAAFQ